MVEELRAPPPVLALCEEPLQLLSAPCDDPPPPLESTLFQAPPPPRFDPSRMVGLIKRKALVKDLAAVYHSQCLTYCRELLELQSKHEEPDISIKVPDESRKESKRPPKRLKKSR